MKYCGARPSCSTSRPRIASTLFLVPRSAFRRFCSAGLLVSVILFQAVVLRVFSTLHSLVSWSHAIVVLVVGLLYLASHIVLCFRFSANANPAKFPPRYTRTIEFDAKAKIKVTLAKTLIANLCIKFLVFIFFSIRIVL